MDAAPVTVAILIYNGVEMVDMNGPLDVFTHANRYNGGRYNVITVAATSGQIKSEAGVVTIVPQFDISNCGNPDIIVIPGIIDEEVDPSMITWLKAQGQVAGKVIMSVCIGALTLAKTGLLSGRRATTHYLAIPEFQKDYPDIDVVKNVRFVDDGNIITTGGITSGIDGALHLIERLEGATAAQRVADLMVYNRDATLPPYTLLPPYDTI